MAQHHKYSMSDIDNMIPYERDLYCDLVKQMMEQQNKENQQ